MNTFTLVGKLKELGKTEQSKSGTSYRRLIIDVQNFKTKQDELFELVCFGETATQLKAGVGDKVIALGKLSSRPVPSKDGRQFWRLECLAMNVATVTSDSDPINW